nr:RNA-directed DNA polymerase, eukaryota, reverse transcriptase zinc-binding domain protein [Tanacetum cinerariifolium]
VARKKFSHRTKEDDVSKISTSIFVTNFPESFSAKDLFHACSKYGHVIDSFIPLKRSIEGKRFGFVKFINVSNVEILGGNLCTIWIGRCKLQANIARFDRTPRNDSNTRAPRKSAKKFDGVNVVEKNGGTVGNGITFANVLSRKFTPIPDNSANGLVIVLDDDCVNSQDLSFSMMGKVKEFASLTNIKSALCNEGFTDLKIRYLGEFWVWLEFNSLKAKDLFWENIGARSWFSDIIPASEDFIPDGRIAWMDVEGVSFKFWTTKTFSKIATKWGKLLEVDDLEENCYHSRRICVYTKILSNIFENFKIVFKGKVFQLRAKEVPGWEPEFLEFEDEDEMSDKVSLEGDCNMEAVPDTVFDNASGTKDDVSEDPFWIYPILNKKSVDKDANEDTDSHSVPYPPGFTPRVQDNTGNDNGEFLEPNKADSGSKETEVIMEKLNSLSEKGCSVSMGRIKITEAPRSGGSFLCLMEDVVKVGVTMGYNMDGLAQKAKKDWVRKLAMKHKVNFLSIQETKMEEFDVGSVRNCWGNHTYEFLHSNSVGNSGGILCVWDTNSFVKYNRTISDYFVIVRGKWLKSDIDLLIVAIYAPHDPRDKRMVWDYLTHVINQWNGSVVIMGDFNDVRFKSERFGSIFNKKGADEFNSFIANSGLEEIPLGGSNFTWCHKSAAMMSKLDRFLVSNNLFNNCPHMSAITLDRFLSDHRFSKFIDDTWNLAPVKGTNALCRLMNKLKFLKNRIREWIKVSKVKTYGDTHRFKEELRILDEAIDKGPDGFTFGFYRHFWSIIEQDVFDAVNYFFINGVIPKGGNPSFITLIMKIPTTNLVKDFKPICLIGSIYKIIAKILADRLVGVLDNIKHEVQSAFISGRQILDGPFILNEILQWCKSKKQQSLIFKVDFEKAFDSVRWDFLDDVLKKFGFGNKWCDWIRCSLTSSRWSILINGSPMEEFQFQNGLKQGDPLSPFLFILIMESLYLSFQRVVDLGLFKGLNLNNTVCLSHMFYANDVVFVGKWSVENINTLTNVLDCFHRASSLKINMSKSKIMGVNLDGIKVTRAASKLRCLSLSNPFSYLGTKVGDFMSCEKAWKEVVDK